MLKTHRDKIIFLCGIALVLILSRFTDAINAYYFQIIIYIGINIILAESLNLINGFTGQFSLGHAGFMAVGAYTSAAITYYIGPELFPVHSAIGEQVFFFVALIAGGCLAAFVGLLVGVPSLRLKGDYLAIVTLGFGEIIRVIVQNLNFVGGPRGFSGIPFYTSFAWTYVFVVVVIFMTENLMRSTYGKGFLAVRDNEIAAEAMGINTTKYKVVAFVISAFFAGIAGGLFAHYLTYIKPDNFTFLKSIEIVVMVILGGMGSTVGAVFAAIVLTILPELLRTVAEYRMVIYALLLVILMLTRPQGIFGGRIDWVKLGKKIRREKTTP
ncbi:MAG TPA: branched-chain amino acid ABC transporter permease [Candidatus Kapabacteria bacterium]|nr:branched-chain amino acid ABC transporter permease [Candidatus Kapabacteria bacterium]